MTLYPRTPLPLQIPSVALLLLFIGSQALQCHLAQNESFIIVHQVIEMTEGSILQISRQRTDPVEDTEHVTAKCSCIDSFRT